MLIYLGSLYARLDECVNNKVHYVGRFDVVTHADTSFPQMFLWEHFGSLAPKSIEFLVMETVEVVIDRVSRKKHTSLYKLRVWR